MDWERARRRELSRLIEAQERDMAVPKVFCRATLKDVRCGCGHRAAVTVPTRRRVKLRCSGCDEVMIIDGTIPG